MRSTTLFIPILMSATLSTSCAEQQPRDRGYSGEYLGTDYTVTRNKYDKKTTFRSEADGPWELFAGRSVEDIDLIKPVASGDGYGTLTIDVPDSLRYYYQVETPRGSALLAERLLPMCGAYNVRDMGGIRTSEGRYTKWGVLFRSDELNNLTSGDLRYLSNIPLRTIVDFRSQEEITQNPDNIPESVDHVYKLSISPGNLTSIANTLDAVSAPMVDKLMSEMNELFVTDSTIIELYRQYFELLQDPDKTPLLFHCTAGKDRTGMAAALVLFSVGADRETVMRDYLQSNRFLEGKFGEARKRYPELADLFGVKEEFLQSGLDKIDEVYGSVENYLTGTLGVDMDRMKEFYLY